jgi:hypothetical protein
MRVLSGICVALLAATSVANAASASVVVSYEGEAPGIQNTTATFSVSGVETFDQLTPGTFNTPVSQTFVDSDSPATITTTFTGGPNGLQINPADVYGGAGGTGNYSVAFSGTPYTLDLTSTNVTGGVNYFGYWLSALDAGNEAKFYDTKGNLLFDFHPQDVLNVVTSKDYYGNPNANFAGINGNEPYVFLNFFSTSDPIAKVDFMQDGGGGYEADNFTVGHYLTMGTGTVIPTPLSDAATPAAMPETTTWAMLLFGFGAIGATLRARQGRREDTHFAVA